MRAAVPMCRIAWRPSRWEQGAVLLLGACAAAGVMASDVAHPWAEALAGFAAVSAMAQAHRGSQRCVRRVVIAREATLDGVRLDRCDLAWRGPLAFLQATDPCGELHRLAWWPDTLPPARRRALRLAMEALAHESSN